MSELSAQISGRVVVLIPCFNDEDTIAETVSVFRGDRNITEIIVIDDGSTDESALRAAEGRARVVLMDRNQGKAAAIAAGIQAEPSADMYLLVDSDTGASAHEALRLLLPLEHGEADMAIGVLPSAGTLGGFGSVKRFARWGIRKASGYEAEAPLSGQRAVRGDVLRALELAPRFGLEVGMTIDAVRSGARVVEVPVEMTHHHRGRGVDGFVHRARQGRDVASILWRRLVSSKARRATLIVSTLLVIAGCLFASQQHGGVGGEPLPRHDNVRIVLIPGGGWDNKDGRLMQPGENAGSMSTGDVKNVVQAAQAGSTDPDAEASPDVRVDVLLREPVLQPGEAVIIAGITTTKQTERLRPVTIKGMDLKGTLTSRSTHREGYVELSDLAPTVLAMQGKPIPSSMVGAPIRFEAGNVDAKKLAQEAEFARFSVDSRWSVLGVYVAAQLLVYLVAWVLSRRGRDLPLIGQFAIAIAAFPLATLVVRWGAGAHDLNIWVWSALYVIAVGMIVVMWFRAVRRPIVALQALLFATAVFICADLLTGANLQIGGVLGASALLAGRNFGLGNPAAAVLLIALVLLCALHVQAATYRRDAIAHVVAAFVVVTAIVGLPGLGADVGGLIAFAATGAVLVMLLLGKRIIWKSGLAISGGAAVCLAVASVVDLLRPEGSRTHLGQLVARIGDDGLSPFFNIVGHKIDANVFGVGFPWNLTIIIAAVASVFYLFNERWTDVLPLGTPVRAGVTAAMIGSLIIYAVNDSGVAMIALVAVFVGPLLLIANHMRLTHQSLEGGSAGGRHPTQKLVLESQDR